MNPFFTVFTPTHDSANLMQAAASLRGQTCKDWEWIVLPNNGCNTSFKENAWFKNDHRIKVLQTIQETKIGALKNLCCSKASGQVFVELDHDDQLEPHALTEIRKALKNVFGDATPGAAFIYSDVACYRWAAGAVPVVFSEEIGWDRYTVNTMMGRLEAARNFKLTPRSLSEVYFAPDHVRAWTRKAYEKTGGHDSRFEIGDDHDLVTRSYLAGTEFIYIPQVLYLYRMHPGNTHRSSASQEQLRRQARSSLNTKLIPLAIEWCRRNRLEVLQRKERPLTVPAGSVGLFIDERAAERPPTFWKTLEAVLAPDAIVQVAVKALEVFDVQIPSDGLWPVGLVRGASGAPAAALLRWNGQRAPGIPLKMRRNRGGPVQ